MNALDGSGTSVSLLRAPATFFDEAARAWHRIHHIDHGFET
jgi:hypothetical protein